MRPRDGRSRPFLNSHAVRFARVALAADEGQQRREAPQATDAREPDGHNRPQPRLATTPPEVREFSRTSGVASRNAPLPERAGHPGRAARPTSASGRP